jgi:hypothetical protein
LKSTRTFTALLCLLPALCLWPGLANASVIHMASGLSSINTPVTFHADLTITGDVLTIDLFNDSVISLAPNDVLGSYYFDIVNANGVRPTLTYQSAVGDVWLARKNQPDILQIPNANLKAVAPGDNTWEFRTMNSTLSPFFGFGLGTVGNANLSPNNFHGNIVDGFDYSLYAGDVTTQNLNNTLLVKNHITFTFTGLTGFAEADIRSIGAFGMGTAPDSLLHSPEPAALALLAIGSLALLPRRRPR